MRLRNHFIFSLHNVAQLSLLLSIFATWGLNLFFYFLIRGWHVSTLVITLTNFAIATFVTWSPNLLLSNHYYRQCPFVISDKFCTQNSYLNVFTTKIWNKHLSFKIFVVQHSNKYIEFKIVSDYVTFNPLVVICFFAFFLMVESLINFVIFQSNHQCFTCFNVWTLPK